MFRRLLRLRGIMSRKGLAVVLACSWLFTAHQSAFAEDILRWRPHKPGLEVGESAPEFGDLKIVRIDPTLWEFSLHMASQGGAPRGLAAWAEQRGLEAGINASMYLPDNKTSTGYMRGSGHVNNPRTGGRLGAFFAAEPESGMPGALPPAAIYERETPNLADLLSSYTVVVQNYRLIDGTGKILWPPGGPLHSVAAVAQDASGRILFILAVAPMPAADFAALLQRCDLSLKTVMYVEGGAQAGVFLREHGSNAPVTVWKGRQSLLRLEGNPAAPLPNVLGVRERKTP